MIRLLPYCLPLILRVTRPFSRPAARATGVATAAKVTAGAVMIGGRVCFDLLMWGGGGAPAVPVPTPFVAVPYAGPALPATSIFSARSTAYDTRDFAALLPAPGASIFPAGDVLVVVPSHDLPGQPVSVPEPSSLALFVLAILGWLGLRKKPKWTTEDYSFKNGRRN